MSSGARGGFERGTPAGNLIHNIYNGKKSMDSTLDPELAARLRKFREEQDSKVNPKVKAVPKSRAHVNVPKPTGGYAKLSDDERRTRIAEYKLATTGSKKKATTIDLENAMAEPLAPPTYSKQPVTEATKQHLQHRMEFGADGPNRPRSSSPIRRRPLVDPDQVRFDEVTREIKERKLFLKELQGDQLSNGQAKLCGGTMSKGERKNLEGKLLIELQDLVDEMKLLDRKLSSKPHYDDDDDDD